MKKSILILGTAVLSMLSLNAATGKMTITTSLTEVEEFTKGDIVQIFEWKVETYKGTYSGTSFSLSNAEEMIALTSNGEVVKTKEIKSFYVLRAELNPEKRNYFWEVKTATGFAKGYSSTEDYAHKMIELVASGDAIVSKMIISQPQQ